MKVAVVQLNAGTDKEKNVSNAFSLVDEAARKGARFVLLPEVFLWRGNFKRKGSLDGVAERVPGKTVKLFAGLAKQRKIYILLGSLYEKVSGTKKVYNTSVLINSQGKIVAKYRKIHLFDAVLGKKKIRESDTFLPGKTPRMVKVNGFNVALSICYDLRFPALYQKYSQKGAHIICVPSAFTEKTGKAHWKSLLQARAIENQVFVLAPNQYGVDGRGVKSFGHSMIVDSWGSVVAQAPANKNKIIYTNINLETIKKHRALLPTIRRSK